MHYYALLCTIMHYNFYKLIIAETAIDYLIIAVNYVVQIRPYIINR